MQVVSAVRSVSERADSMPPVPVPVTGEPLALELVNTTFIDGGLRGRLIDALTTPGQLKAWVVSHHERFSPDLQALLPEAIYNPETLGRFLELRSALRACLTAVTGGSTPEPDEAATVNRFAAEGAFRLALTPGRPVAIRRRWPTDDPLTNALGEIAADACELLMPDRIGKVKACPAPGCILFFEKSHPRREWCSPACGNRVRVARHTRSASQA